MSLPEYNDLQPVTLEVQALRERFAELSDMVSTLRNEVEVTGPIAITDQIANMADELRAEASEPIQFNNLNYVSVTPSGNPNSYDVRVNDPEGFKATTYTDNGAYKLKIREGTWQHNETRLTSEWVGEGSGNGVWTLSGNVDIYAGAVGALDAPFTGVKVGTDAELNAEDDVHPYYRVKLVSATDGSGEPHIDQYHKGGIVTASAIPDTGTAFASEDLPVTKTLEWNPVASLHKGELQMYDAAATVASLSAVNDYRIPFLTLVNTDGDGELYWYAADSDMPFLGNGDYLSLALNTTSSALELYQFADATDTALETAIAPPLFVFREVYGGTNEARIRYAGVTNVMDAMGKDMWNYIIAKVYAETADWTTLDHNKLNFAPTTAGTAGQNYDHAEAHPVIGSTYSGTGPGVGGVWFQNIGRGNATGGSSADAMAIDLMNMRLHDVTAYYTLDWDEAKLYTKATGGPPATTQGVAVLDWDELTLINTSSEIVVDWKNKALEDDGTENLTWDSTSVDISSGPVFKVLNSTAAGYQSGALQCSGGGFFQNGIYSVPAPASVDAGVFTDDTVNVNIVHHSGNYAIEANHGVATAVTICDSTNAVDATTGPINANSTSGFTVGGTQVVLDQQSTTGQTAGFTAGSGTGVNDDSTFTGGSGTKAYTIGDIVKHLKYHGLIASS